MFLGINPPPPEPRIDPISGINEGHSQMINNLISFLLFLVENHLGLIIIAFVVLFCLSWYVSFILSVRSEGQRIVYDSGDMLDD